MDINCAGERNWRRRYRTPNFEEADLPADEAEALKATLEEAGATVELR